jgi:hypothetical protein
MSIFAFVMTTVIVASGFPAAAQVDPAPAAGDSTTAPVELPAPPVAAVPAPDNGPAVVSPAVTVEAPVGGVAPAQGSAAAPLFVAAGDTLTVLVDYRAESEISRDLQNAVTEKALAERRLDRASMLATVAGTHIDIKTSEIKGLDAQIALAKSEKNDAKRAELEGRRKYAETEKQLLERRRDLRRREIDTARAVKSFHDAAAKACRLEMDLAVKRRERASITSTVDPNAAAEYRRLQTEITKLEGSVLNAQVDQAAKRKDLAEQEVQLGKVRRAVYESQLKVAR